MHDNYGGNRQGGISNCANHPFIFVFTGKAGKSHGYEDGWSEDGYFLYTGEEQNGDMTFTKGNKALLNHELNNKKLYLFENQNKGQWKFIDEIRLIDYTIFDTPDTKGNQREGIKFKFMSVSGSPASIKLNKSKTRNINIPGSTERVGLVTSRVGQGFFRKQLIDKWNSKCSVTSCSIIEILIASHIVPWSEATDYERLDVDNGVLLSPTIDALFDKHLISFKDDGSIIIGDGISKEDINLLGVSNNMRIEVSKGMKKYLARHRAMLSNNDFNKSII
ncbi:HNH endonuclease [Cellulophaga baltica]|uniref:HNH endonuclease n=1 Tax=Cellulophaga baltica TaxID=76594 RepID=UPI002148C713|nr:HNH endonuclease signature motif containing protein [Cellulophaga baltica]MCR1026978.1 HNH endonuclease [Cellulophaga baltica]